MNCREYIINETLVALICCSLVYVSATGLLAAAPAAGDLLKACEHSLKNGFAGIEGDMCTWYVTPCDCDYGKGNDMPRVCLPDRIAVETLARIVVAGLKDQPGFHAEDADFAAARILSRVYPCNE
jgi:hypothetical protein